jgi:hypothetical protein
MVEDADENKFLVPDLQGKKDYGVAMKIASLMTSFGYMRTEVHDVPLTKEEGEEQKFKSVKRRVIYFEDTGTMRGKDRTNTLRPFIIQPTLAKIRKAVAGQMVRDNEGKIVNKGGNADGAKKAPAKAPVVKKAGAKASPKPDDVTESKEATERLNRNPDTKAKVQAAERNIDNATELDSVEA